MGQTATSPRVLSGAEEFDRRMRSIAQAQNAHTDAMAELARIVGRSDPFAPPPQPAAELPSAAAADPGEEPGAPVEPAVVHNTVDPETWERIVSQYPSITPKDEPVPDQWALALDDDDFRPAAASAAAPQVVAVREATPAAEPENSRRTLTVLAAVVVLTAGGLGASFLVRPGGSAMATATSAPPTIMAAAGPAKIQPEPQAADAPSEPSTLLDKSGSDGTAAAKVVNTTEQPVDLSQAVKPAAPSADVPPARPSAFPEPRKVRTVMVRPDGSIMADTGTSAAAVAADANALPDAQQASLAFDPKTTLAPPPAAPREPSEVEAALAARTAPPADPAAPAAEPATRTSSGKTTARATPRAAASTSQDGAAQARSPVATPKSKPAHAAPKPKPVAEAPAAEAPPVQVAAADPAPVATATDPAPTSAVSGGSFAIQLGASPSQAEGDAAATRLAQKYGAELNGLSPKVHKAQAGGKTVYRIRVGNLSQDGAKALCAKVQAGGGGCFVARN